MSIAPDSLASLPFSDDICFPSTGRRVRSFLRANKIATQVISTRGGWRTTVRLSDLPPETQLAYLQRQAGVDPAGTNPELWQAFGKETPKTR